MPPSTRMALLATIVGEAVIGWGFFYVVTLAASILLEILAAKTGGPLGPALTLRRLAPLVALVFWLMAGGPRKAYEVGLDAGAEEIDWLTHDYDRRVARRQTEEIEEEAKKLRRLLEELEAKTR